MDLLKKRWLYLAVGTLMMLVLGLVYAWSVFVAPLEAEFGWSRTQTSITFTVSIFCFTIGLIACGLVAGRFRKRVLLLIAALCMLAGFLACSRVTSLTGLYIFYGVFVGFGVGIANNVLVSTFVRWFPERTGLASGILMMGFGMGGMILSPLAVYLIGVMGWRNTFLWFGIIFAAIQILGSLAVVVPPEDFKGAPGKEKRKASAGIVHEHTTGQMLKTSSFWFHTLWGALLLSCGLMIIGHAKPFAMDLGATDNFAAWATGLLSLCNGLGRVLSGVICDRVSVTRNILILSISMGVACVILYFALITASMALLVIGFILAGLSYGGMPTTGSALITSFYGTKHFSLNYGILCCDLLPATIVGPTIAASFRDASGSYQSSFIVMIVFMALAIIASRLIRKPTSAPAPAVLEKTA